MCDVCVCVDVLGVDSVYVMFVYLGCGLCVCVMLCVWGVYTCVHVWGVECVCTV